MLVEFLHQHECEVFYAGFIPGTADIEYLAIAYIVGVIDYSVKAFYAFGNVGETAFLFAAVDKLDGGAFNEVEDQLSYRS